MGIRRTLGIGFLVGLFLIGVGGGVTFAEFSSFKMDEVKVIGIEAMDTEIWRETIPSESDTIYVNLPVHMNRQDVKIEKDPSMGPEEIEFELNYNKDVMAYGISIYSDENKFYVNYYSRDYLGLNYMEDALDSIKRKRIPNFRIEYFGEQIIRVAPENESRVKLIN